VLPGGGVTLIVARLPWVTMMATAYHLLTEIFYEASLALRESWRSASENGYKE